MIEGVSSTAFDEAVYNDLWLSINSENAKVIDDLLAKHNLEALIADIESPAMNVVPLAGVIDFHSVNQPRTDYEDGRPTDTALVCTNVRPDL